MRRSWILALVILPVVAACGGGRAPEAAVPAGGTVPAITPADLKLRSAIFADDSMLGRRAGTVGNVRGNAYIAGELARLGLTPAGDSGGFLQRVPLTSYALDTARTALRAGASPLAAFSDFYPYQPTFAVPVRPINGAQLVYLGAPAASQVVRGHLAASFSRDRKGWSGQWYSCAGRIRWCTWYWMTNVRSAG